MAERATATVLAAPSPALAHVVLERVFAFGCVFLLFGDYLTLSLARASSGTAGNWLLYTAVLQLPLVALAVMLGRLDRRALTAPVLALLGVGLVIAGHVTLVWLSGGELSEYAADKSLNWFGVCLPALACGMAIGRSALLARPRGFLIFAVPLWVMCAAALAIDPALLTVAHYADLAVFLGVLVLPAHQALAFALAKIGLCALSLADAAGRERRLRIVWFVATAATFGLLLLTGARTYVVGAVLALALLNGFWSRNVARTLVVAAAGIALALAFPSDLLSERIDPWQVAQSLSFEERIDVWGVALESFVEHPLFGVGPGGFADRMFWGGRVYPHNLVLEFLSELGLVGTALFAVALGAVVRRVVRFVRSRRQATSTQWFAVGFFVFSVVGAMAVGDWMRNSFLFLAIGMCLTAVPIRGARSTS